MDKYYYTALGDSLTYGFAASIFDGFAYRLCRYLKKNCKHLTFKNLGQSGITSTGLLLKLQKNSNVRCAVENSDIITITIGGNNLLKSTFNNYNCINKTIAEKNIIKFTKDWPLIMNCIRNDIVSSAHICVMTIYNPFCPTNKCYELADFYINRLNDIITNTDYINTFMYSVADVYSDFRDNKSENWTLFNKPIRDPHPTTVGNYQIAKAFKNCICLPNAY